MAVASATVKRRLNGRHLLHRFGVACGVPRDNLVLIHASVAMRCAMGRADRAVAVVLIGMACGMAVQVPFETCAQATSLVVSDLQVGRTALQWLMPFANGGSD